ncbi:MAG: ribonuclease Z [Ruminococcus sp.]|nr:ribonuclease Z [Ruminococcus sp.]
MLNINIIGTGGMMPLLYRWLASAYLSCNGKSVLIDCGEGTQLAVSAAKLSHRDIGVILFTHYHADHISGLPGMLLMMGNCGRTEPVQIYGPLGIGGIIKSLMCICPKLPFEVKITELDSNRTKFSEIGLEVESVGADHTVKCLAYSVTLHRKPVFNPQKAKELGVPLEYWKILHKGESIGGFKTEDVIDDVRKPLKFTYCTDSRPSYAVTDLAYKSDLLICEGLYGVTDDVADVHRKGHMTFSEAAYIARDAEVSELWLTHYSPAMQNPKEFEHLAKKIFANTKVCKDGYLKILK